MHAMRGLGVILWAFVAGAASAQGVTALRVCADPDHLPQSHRNGSGFENRIAALLAADLGLPLQYTWLPGVGVAGRGAAAATCDLLVGVPAGSTATLNTRPYYRSTYVLVDQAGGTPVRDFSDPRLPQWRIGVPPSGEDGAGLPPAQALAQAGAAAIVAPATAEGPPAAARLVQAVARGELDAAFAWGPQAGYHVRQAQLQGHPRLRMQVVETPSPQGTRPFEREVAAGVLGGQAALRDRIDEVLLRRRADIERILANHGVPLLELEER
jgi:ABC-type amino acid transport substrate-binding protein